jgi:hypothetical protein
MDNSPVSAIVEQREPPGPKSFLLFDPGELNPARNGVARRPDGREKSARHLESRRNDSGARSAGSCRLLRAAIGSGC